MGKIINFGDKVKFNKTFINTNYTFDVLIWVINDSIKNIKGEKLSLRNIAAVKYTENSEVNIFLNVADNAESNCASDEPIEYFENAAQLKTEILQYILEHIEEFKYNEEDKKEDNTKVESEE